MMKHFNKSALVLIGFVLTMISIQSASAQLKDKVRNIQNGLSKDHVRLGNGSVLIVPRKILPLCPALMVSCRNHPTPASSHSS